jgi:hypothetical protein
MPPSSGVTCRLLSCSGIYARSDTSNWESRQTEISLVPKLSAWARTFRKLCFLCLLCAMDSILWSREAGASGKRVPKETLGTRCQPTRRNLPDRAWRFGPTATLSGRGDQVLGDAGRVERSARHRRIIPAPVASSRGLVGPSSSRMRRHRWFQANESRDAACRLGKRQVSLRKELPRLAY